MTRVGETPTRTNIQPQHREPQPVAPSSFAEMLAQPQSADAQDYSGTSIAAYGALPDMAARLQPFAPDQIEAPWEAQGFAATGPFGLARPTTAPAATNAMQFGAPSPGEDATEDIGEHPNASSFATTHNDDGAGIGPTPRAAVHEPSGARGERLPLASEDAPEVSTALAPTRTVEARLRTATSSSSAQHQPRSSGFHSAKPNALSVRVTENAGAIAVRATLPDDAARDNAALAHDVESMLREHALEGTLFVNGRRIHAQKERFDV